MKGITVNECTHEMGCKGIGIKSRAGRFTNRAEGGSVGYDIKGVMDKGKTRGTIR